MRDKYGYDIPNKESLTISKGSGPAMEVFQKNIDEIVKIAKAAYPDEKYIQNRYNLLLSAISEMLAIEIKETVTKHENGETPLYGKVIARNNEVIKRMGDLESVLVMQDVLMSKYLNDCPELMREENKVMIEETRKMSNVMADVMEERFKKAWTERFGSDNSKDYGQ